MEKDMENRLKTVFLMEKDVENPLKTPGFVREMIYKWIYKWKKGSSHSTSSFVLAPPFWRREFLQNTFTCLLGDGMGWSGVGCYRVIYIIIYIILYIIIYISIYIIYISYITINRMFMSVCTKKLDATEKRPPSPNWTCGFQSLWSTSWQFHWANKPPFHWVRSATYKSSFMGGLPVSVAGYGLCSATSQGSSRKNMYMDTMCSVAEWPNICPHWCCLRTTEVRSTVQSRQKFAEFYYIDLYGKWIQFLQAFYPHHSRFVAPSPCISNLEIEQSDWLGS
jgi:hypothetical protein